MLAKAGAAPSPTPSDGRGVLGVWPPPAWIAAAALGLFIALGVLVFDARLFGGGDNVVYYLLAKALATGRGYVTLYEPGDPPHALYPPGYPVLLMPIFWLFGGSLWAGKILSFAAAAGAVALAAHYLRERLAPRPASGIAFTLAVALLATNTTLLAYAHWMLTEAPYLALSLGALLLAERGRRGTRTWLAAALLAPCAYLVRTAALPLCAAVAWGVWRNHGRRAGLIAAAISAATVAAWTIRNSIVAPEAAGYLEQLISVNPYDPASGILTLESFAKRVVANLGLYAFLEIPRLVWPFLPAFGGPKPVVGYLAGAVLVSIMLYGFARQASARGMRAGEVYAVLYAGLLAVWPWSGDRFLLPLVPLLLSYLGIALVDLVGIGGHGSRTENAGRTPARASGRRRRLLRRPPGHLSLASVVAAAAIALLVAPNVYHALKLAPEQLSVTAAHLRGDRLAGYVPALRDYFAAALWLRENAPSDAVVVSRKPQFTYLFSDRKSILYPYGTPEEIERAVRRSAASYLIYDRLGASALVYLQPYLARYLDAYSVAHRVGEPATLVLARVAR